jgi:hypothetical protein
MPPRSSHPSSPLFASAPSTERAPLVDASALAAELGVSRDFVYEHSAELGALRLGSGPRARLRFDAAAARAALFCWGSERSQAPDSALRLRSEDDGRRVIRQTGRSSARSGQQPGSILPVRPRKAAR